jgi:hypothetical protein
MGYVSTVRQLRRNPALGAAGLVSRGALGRLGDDGGGFSWGSFASGIAQSAAQGAATAGVNLLRNIGTPSAPKPIAAPAPTAAFTTAAGGVPIYVWALGGLGLVLILVLAMRR